MQNVGKRRDDNNNNEYVNITNVDLEYLDISEDVAMSEKLEDKSVFAYWKLLYSDVILRTSIGIILQFFQQLTGINAIMYYSSSIFVSIGANANQSTAITGAVNVAATFIAIYCMDRVGRRPLLLWGAAG